MLCERKELLGMCMWMCIFVSGWWQSLIRSHHVELSWSVTQSAQQLDDSLLLASPGINQSCKSSPASGCCSCDTENGVFANSYELPSKNQFVSTEQRQNCHLTTAAVNSGSVITLSCLRIHCLFCSASYFHHFSSFFTPNKWQRQICWHSSRSILQSWTQSGAFICIILCWEARVSLVCKNHSHILPLHSELSWAELVHCSKVSWDTKKVSKTDPSCHDCARTALH